MKVYCDTDRFIRETIDGEEYRFAFDYPVIIDIGANVGAFSLFMYPVAKKIYAIEPSEENVNNLLKTKERNQLNNLEVHQLAIGGTNFGRMMERVGSAGGGGWRLSESGTVPVDCRTLENFMDGVGIEYADLVKVDIEGAELEMFGTPLFPKDRIGKIVGEFHYQENTPQRETILDLLKWMGFNVTVFPNNMFVAKKL